VGWKVRGRGHQKKKGLRRLLPGQRRRVRGLRTEGVTTSSTSQISRVDPTWGGDTLAHTPHRSGGGGEGRSAKAEGRGGRKETTAQGKGEESRWGEDG